MLGPVSRTHAGPPISLLSAAPLRPSTTSFGINVASEAANSPSGMQGCRAAVRCRNGPGSAQDIHDVETNSTTAEVVCGAT